MRKLVSFATFLILAQTAQADLYGGANHPSNFNRIAKASMVLEFDSLPLSGKLSDDRYGWSESYWPSNKGGIAYRWNHPDPQPFKFRLHSRDEIQGMSQQQLSQLSPAELYDIAMGDYNYTLTRRALKLYNPRDLWWEGICHGWAQAAANYPEPAPVVVTNPQGVRVPFGSSDVKALLAMHDAYNFKGTTFAFLGKRCAANGKVTGEGDERDRNPNPPPLEAQNTEECKDVNAGAFHVVTANMIGIHSRGFVADIDRFNDVWNQPVTAYSSQIIGEEPVSSNHSSQGISRRLRMRMKFTYGEELKFYTPELEAEGKRNFVSKLPVTGTPHQEFRSKDYEYILELDSRGRIIGGEWITETRPDFLWIFDRHKQFVSTVVPLQGLNKIYRPVRR